MYINSAELFHFCILVSRIVRLVENCVGRSHNVRMHLVCYNNVSDKHSASYDREEFRN